VVVEFSGLLKAYGISKVTGPIWRGIEYLPSEKPKSDIYRDLLPLLNSGRTELLDLPRLTTQLIGLERRTSRSGKDSLITHLGRITTSPTPFPAPCCWPMLPRPPCGARMLFFFVTGCPRRCRQGPT
jgi:hypothetical protein